MTGPRTPRTPSPADQPAPDATGTPGATANAAVAGAATPAPDETETPPAADEAADSLHATATLHSADTHRPHCPEARHIPFKLHRARDRLAGQLRHLFDPFGLTDPQWRVLRTLSVVDEIDTMALARRAFLLGPSLSRILRDLGGRNLIRRRSDTQDARRSFYTLTNEGRALVNAVLPAFQPMYARIERDMGREAIVELCTLLDRLTESLAAPLPGANVDESPETTD